MPTAHALCRGTRRYVPPEKITSTPNRNAGSFIGTICPMIRNGNRRNNRPLNKIKLTVKCFLPVSENAGLMFVDISFVKPSDPQRKQSQYHGTQRHAAGPARSLRGTHWWAGRNRLGNGKLQKFRNRPKKARRLPAVRYTLCWRALYLKTRFALAVLRESPSLGGKPRPSEPEPAPSDDCRLVYRVGSSLWSSRSTHQ